MAERVYKNRLFRKNEKIIFFPNHVVVVVVLLLMSGPGLLGESFCINNDGEYPAVVTSLWR